MHQPAKVDRSSLALVRDPNKCVLCGDCVRFCSEIQGIGAIDFAYRGHDAAVLPAFGNDLGEGECVNCGQCAAVCPTGALTPKSEIDEVWKALQRSVQNRRRADCSRRARRHRRAVRNARRRNDPRPDGRRAQAARVQ